jgi:hypothetical protein
LLVGDAFELFQPLDVALERFAPTPGPRCTDRVGRRHQGRIHAGGFDVTVVPEDSVEHFGAFVVALAEIVTDLRVAALQFVVQGFPNIVQQAAAAGQASVEPQLVGHVLAQEGDLDAVPQDVLPVTGAVGQAAEQFELLFVQPADIGFDRSGFARLHDVLFDVLGDFLDDLLDPSGVNASVLNQPFQTAAGHFPADRIKRADHHHPGRVIHNDIDPGRLLERADVSPFATDDPPLHLVGRNVHGGDGAGRGVLGGVALDCGDGDFPRALFRGLAGLGEGALDEAGGVVFDIVGEIGEQLFFGFFDAQAADADEFVASLLEQLTGFGFARGDRGLPFLERGLRGFDFAFFDFEGVELLIDHVFALGQTFFDFFVLGADGGGFFFKRLHARQLGGFGVHLRAFDDVVGFLLGVGEHLLGALRGRCGGHPGSDGQRNDGGCGAPDHSDDDTRRRRELGQHAA